MTEYQDAVLQHPSGNFVADVRVSIVSDDFGWRGILLPQDGSTLEGVSLGRFHLFLPEQGELTIDISGFSLDEQRADFEGVVTLPEV